MQYRTLGRTDIQASVVTFGAWAIGGWMWGGADRREAVEAIRASIDAGVTSIDTAPVYGQGLSEEIVAEALEGIPREKVQILTKFGMRWDIAKGVFAFDSQDNSGKPIKVYKYARKDGVIKECEDCLRRLKTDYLDLYQQHWPDTTTPISETMEALAQLEQQGKIRAGAVCNYSALQVREAEQTYPIASDQVPYSMVRREIELELVPYCQNNNIAILAYSPLQRGLLTGKIKAGHRFNEGDTREGNVYYSDENIAAINAFLDKLRPLAEAKKATLGQLVIRWTIDQPGITVALVGARNAQQAIENAAAADITLSPDDHEFIARELSVLEIKL